MRRLFGGGEKGGSASPHNHASRQYGPLPAQGGGGKREGGGGGGGSGDGGYDGGGGYIPAGSSEWLSRQKKGNRKLKWIVGILLLIVLLGAIAGGVTGGVLGAQRARSNSAAAAAARSGTRGGGGSGSSGSPKDDYKGGGLTHESPEIKKLLDNPALHRVFPGVDYTPLNAQYPECLSAPPRQSEVTKDVAVLAQLTKQIRLYGTDCNQTELVLHALGALGARAADVKVWLGVWQDRNATTNARQLEHMYRLLDEHHAPSSGSGSGTTSNKPSSPFAGVVIGNEALYRQDLTETQLGRVVADVRANMSARGWANLPVATSDLGDKWTPALARQVDVVMSNVHPFFAGVTADEAAGWTWSFWNRVDGLLAAGAGAGTGTGTGTAAGTGGRRQRHIVSEVGWPSGGGNLCTVGSSGTPAPCASRTAGSVAGVAQMNKFMDTYVCQSLANGTEFFW